jgi:GT2 family glycosyltransferase
LPPSARGDVHAIVVNFRTPELTIGAIEHLRASTLPGRGLHVTVVDNGSGDDSADRIAASARNVRLIRAPDNLGFAGGNNLAMRAILDGLATTIDRRDTYVLLLNSDVEVDDDALQRCVRFLEQHSEAGIVGPKVLLPDGRLDLACRRGFPTPARAFWKLTGVAKLFPRSPYFTGYNLTHLDEDTTCEVDAVAGAYMLVRLAAIDDVGLLDTAFFMYGEDLDWAYRIKQHGWRVYYHPAAHVRHLKGATARQQSYRMIHEFYRAMWVFHRKHYARDTFLLLNWLVLAGIVARGLLATFLNALRPADSKRVA